VPLANKVEDIDQGQVWACQNIIPAKVPLPIGIQAPTYPIEGLKATVYTNDYASFPRQYPD